MKLATIQLKQQEVAALMTPNGLITISEINKTFGKAWPSTVFEILDSGDLSTINAWYLSGGKKALESMAEHAIPMNEACFAPLLRRPRKIWGIGLNYVDHAQDLNEKPPSNRPGSFNKFSTTIIGPNDPINIPRLSNRTTGEAELAVVFGKKAQNIDPENWLDVVAGFTTVIDMTAEDILVENPRYLVQSKNFDTFFSLGAILVTPDEIEDINALHVATVLNGEVYAKNVVSNMTFKPSDLVSYHSKIATMLPGDIISTGTPRAVPLKDGDVIECQIDGFYPLSNPVYDLKLNK